MNSKPLQPESEESELRILLWGRTGYGRSTLGNAILNINATGDEIVYFPTGQSASSVTKEYKKMTGEFDGQTLAVVDTPGVFCTDTDQKGMMKGILESTMSIQPGPHVILLVLKQNKFTREDVRVLEIFNKVFPGAAAYTITVVTHADQQQAEEFLKSKQPLKEFVKKFHAFDKDDPKVDSLVKMIKEVVKKNNTTCYKNELIEKSQDALEKVLQCPEVKSAAEPEKAASAKLVGWISNRLDQEFPAVKGFFDFLESVAYNWMTYES
uniref:AIG1-type G domain-containing protein n=1 Tax=Mastacembelus armatus TaxID=205130 RepID=A0A7N8YIV9_9TELE